MPRATSRGRHVRGLVEAISSSHRWWWSLTLTAVIMHSWYDGFVWSVQRRQVDASVADRDGQDAAGS
ncbi:MAG: hypothetical protein QF664_13465 [Dehalococcoidia bacterium]|nr:hypothetical protein [Dehalococcoidia bacterium]